MATAEQIKSLIRSHFSHEPEHFYTVALQVAAHEARRGHESVAQDLRKLIEAGRKSSKKKDVVFHPDLKGLLLKEESRVSKQTLVINQELKERLNQTILEYRQKGKLRAFGLSHRRKMLLVGPPGTGKTMTTKVLAYELRIPVYTIQIDRLVTKFMGETSAKLRQVFDFMKEHHGIFFFDEFDAIGGNRSLDNDVGEIRRVLNAFLQFIEQEESDNIIISATNNPQLLDQALFRRFDDVLFYDYPGLEEIQQLILNRLGQFKPKKIQWEPLIDESKGLSHSEIVLACNDAIKKAILSNEDAISQNFLSLMLHNRQKARKGFNH